MTFEIELFSILVHLSFISCSFVRDHSITTRQLGTVLQVLQPEDPVLVGEYVRLCPIVLGDHVLRADLTVLPLKEFDVVLGLDWLTEHHAVIDCERQLVILRTPGKE